MRVTMNEDQSTSAAIGRTDRILGLAHGEADVCCAGEAINTCAEAPRTIRTAVDVRADSHFERALGACKDGHRITRAGWNGSNQHVEMHWPAKDSRMTQPYLALKNAQNEFVPWVPSQGDLFARDWAILPR